MQTVVLALLAAGAVYAMPPYPGVDMPQSAVKEQLRLGVNVAATPVRDAGKADVHNGPGDVQPLVTGTKRFPVIAISFPDYESAYAASSFQNMLFGSWASGTAKQYYQEVSYGQFTLGGTVAGWFTADSNKAYYGMANGFQRAAKLVKEAAMKADATVDFSQFDNDGDGYVDAFTCIHSWYGAEETGNGNDIWSHEWSLSSAGIGAYITNDPWPGHPGQYIKVDLYTIDPERSSHTNNGTMACIGVFCHEWGHALGLPDLYDTGGAGSGLGLYCLMSAGSWGGDYNSPWCPVDMCAWSKMELGWLNPRAVRAPNNYSLNPVETNSDAYWLISRNRTFREYFVLENRHWTGFDQHLQGQGLFIYHIDDSVVAARRPSNSINSAATGWKYGVALEQADGTDALYNGSDYGDAGDPYPGNTGNTHFDSTANPNSKTNYPLAAPLMSGCLMRNPSISPGPAATCSLASGATGSFTGGPDFYGNSWIDSDTTGGPAFSWLDISGSGTLLGNGDDSRWGALMPFTFTFCGASYDSIWVCTNGWLSFGGNPLTSNPSNVAIPNTSLPNNALYAFWDDLVFVASDSGGVYYQVTGTAPNRFCVVMWKNARIKGGLPWNTVTFEALIGEDGSLVTQYQDCGTGDSTSNWGHSATVGIEDANGLHALQYLCNGSPMGNLLSNKRAIRFVAPPGVHDVAVTGINAPTGTIDSGTVVAPACSTYNRGNVTETYRVRMKIGSFYNQETLVTGHVAGTGRYVAFPSTAVWPRGTFAESCYSEMAVDTNRHNDTATGSVTVRVLDVACAALFGPSGTVDSGTVVTPACSVYNYGTTSQTYLVRMRIGAVYNNAVLVGPQAPGTGTRVTFTPWGSTVVGTFAVRCSTELAGDARHGNDSRWTTLTVRHVGGDDVGCVAILAPAGIIDSGLVVTPACSLRNYGTLPETYRVRMRMGSYNDTAHVAGHAGGTTIYVTLPPWVARPVGAVAVTCSTELATDESPGNDAMTGSVNVSRAGADVGCTRLIMPTGVITSGALVTPACSVYNYGRFAVSYPVRMRIGSAYDSTVSVTNHQPGTGLLVQFPNWYATPTGTRNVTVCTEAGDMNPANDTVHGTCSVVLSATGGWGLMGSMLAVPTTKPGSSGGWLAYNAGTSRIYVAKGNKTGDFYLYSPMSNSWLLRTSIPAGSEHKLPYTGATAVTDGNNYLYATTGNSSLMFWRYDMDADTWHELAKVPLGAYRKKVKGGTDMAYVDLGGTPYIYLLKGYKTEFYRYSIVNDSWQTLDPAPTPSRPKWAPGSFMVYDGGTNLYAHKAYYHEFWRFDMNTMKWDVAHMLPGMPVYSWLTGHVKKSKDGGCAAWYYDAVYALKGGNTQEFWKYVAADTQWVELETLPQVGLGPTAHKVKGGADIVSTDDGALYATKGGKTFDLWRYLTMPAMADGQRAPRYAGDGSAAANQLPTGGFGLTIAPNPLASGFATLTWSAPGHSSSGPATLVVYDAIGRRVRSQTVPASRASLVLDLRGLAAGVYLVRLEAGAFSATDKLVVQH